MTFEAPKTVGPKQTRCVLTCSFCLLSLLVLSCPINRNHCTALKAYSPVALAYITAATRALHHEVDLLHGRCVVEQPLCPLHLQRSIQTTGA